MSNEFVFLEVRLINLSNNETSQLQIPLGNNQVRMTHFMFLNVKLQNKQCSSLKRPPAVLTLCQSAVLTHQWMSCEFVSVSNQLFFPKNVPKNFRLTTWYNIILPLVLRYRRTYRKSTVESAPYRIHMGFLRVVSDNIIELTLSPLKE